MTCWPPWPEFDFQRPKAPDLTVFSAAFKAASLPSWSATPAAISHRTCSSWRTLARPAGEVSRSDLIYRMVILSSSSPHDIGTRTVIGSQPSSAPESKAGHAFAVDRDARSGSRTRATARMPFLHVSTGCVFDRRRDADSPLRIADPDPSIDPD